MINYIYCYINNINGKLYVGQTNNIDRRIREHKSNSFNQKSINYNNIIHKAIRKYGYENFTVVILEVLENKTYEEVNEREKYWIKEKKSLISQNGYNIIEGGNNYWRSSFSCEEINDIKNMIISGKPYSDIVNKYGISKSFISNINNGQYFYEKNIIYPLYNYRINNDIYDSLIEDLEKPELTFKQLADKYSLAESTIKKFNYGTLQTGYYNGEYPIRKITPAEYKSQLIKDYLINTSLSKKEIVKLTNSSEETVRRINLGLAHKDDNLIYPLRQ